MIPADNGMTRAEFLRTCGRYGLLGLLTLGLVRLARRPGGSDRNPEQCVSRGICRGCPVLGDCGLPSALSAKAASLEAGGKPQ